jgi:hypothetical protein
VDEGRRLGHVVDVVAFEDDAILHRLIAVRLDTFEHVAHASALFAKEVADFNNRPVLLNVDVHGEVSVHSAHLVAETLGDTVKQVRDVANGRAQATGQLVAREPHRRNDFILFVEREVELRDVVEVAANRAGQSR